MKRKIKLKVVFAVLLFLLLVFVGIIAFKLFSKNNNFSADADTGFYSGRCMTYNNGILTVKDPNYGYVDTYDLRENKKSKTDIPMQEIYHNYVKYGTKIAYVDTVAERVSREEVMSGFKDRVYLYIYDTEDKSEKEVFDNCKSIVFCKNSVAYSDEEQNILLYCVDSGETELLCEKFDGKIADASAMNDYLYIISERGSKTFITIFSVTTKNQTAEIEIEENLKDYIIIPNDEQIVVHPVGNFRDLRFYDFSGNKTVSDLSHSDLLPSELNVFNKDYQYNSVRRKETSIFYDRTLFSPTNGLYQTNNITGETVKLSDKCYFEEILATDNYVYCCEIDYVISQGIIKTDISTGYTLLQIPVNK